MHEKVLLLCDWYEPGYKAGGPIQSCRNLVQKLKQQYQFYVLTSDRDIGDKGPYQGITRNSWQDRDGARVMYCQTNTVTAGHLRDIIDSLQPEVVYLNSMYSLRFTLLPLFVLLLGKSNAKIILAPRGMLQQGAMAHKTTKKKLFLQLFALMRWNRRLRFHATDKQEASDILFHFPKGTDVRIAANIPDVSSQVDRMRHKEIDHLHAVFISRIHPKKNLHFILNLLPQLNGGDLQFDIYGEEDDSDYAARCKSLVKNLTPNLHVRFFGPIRHQQVLEVLQRAHLFILPTLGENFGHAIFEALYAGCPVLISDRTPWRDLEKHKAGWDFSLEQPQEYVNVLRKMLSIDDRGFKEWSNGAYKKSSQFLTENNYEQQYQALFS